MLTVCTLVYRIILQLILFFCEISNLQILIPSGFHPACLLIFEKVGNNSVGGTKHCHPTHLFDRLRYNYWIECVILTNFLHCVIFAPKLIVWIKDLSLNKTQWPISWIVKILDTYINISFEEREEIVPCSWNIQFSHRVK